MPSVAAPNAAAAPGRRVPERRCVVCRRIAARDQLRRVSRRADGLIAFDPEARLEGRSAYFCRSANCALAVTTDPKWLARALRAAPPQRVLDEIARHADAQFTLSSQADCKESL